MDHQRLPRRCASHGTLRSSYNPHRRPAHSMSTLRPLHKPLRAVNENSILLPSPGALEGMLKTTTETGDIGMWTIKPMLPSTQRRQSFSQVTRSFPFLDRPYGSGASDRAEPQRPSRSQTLSEVQSLYTSGSQRSINSTLPSNSTGDFGHRSLSMTTCGSRHLPRQASNLTMQTHPSSLRLQRPRSPFPYPTRLKRPGVRPASPALTETGLVDYSRMVEIDRISSRTEHGSFRSLDPIGPQNRVPLGIRNEVNGSAPHLNRIGVFEDNRVFRAPYPRTISAASIASWNARNQSYTRPTEPRAFSLTSHTTRPLNVNSEKTSSIVSRPNNSSLEARYFDYSENFATGELDGESAASSRSTPGHSLAGNTKETQRRTAYDLNQESEGRESTLSSVESQIPTPETPRHFQFGSGRERVARVDSTRSCTLDNDNENDVQSPWGSHIDQGGEDPVCHVNNIDLLPSQVARSSIDTFNPNMDVEAANLAVLDFPCYRTVAVQKLNSCALNHHIYTKTMTAPTIHSEQGVIFGDEPGEDPNSQDSVAGDVVTWLPEDHDSPGRAARHSASFTQTSGNRDQLDFSDKQLSVSRVSTSSHGCATTTTASPESASMMKSHVEIEAATSRELDACYRRIQRSMTEPRSMHKNTPSTIQGHRTLHLSVPPAHESSRRKGMLTRISDPLPRRSTIAMPDSANDRLATALFEPTPISACRQLEMKNSIPQLMKALPPAPKQPETTGEQDSITNGNGEYSEILKTYTYTASPAWKQRDSPVSNTTGVQQCSPVLSQVSPQKLRLKITPTPPNPTPKGSLDLDASSPSKPARRPSQRLRLRSPRSSRQSTSRDEMIESALPNPTVLTMPISEMHESTRSESHNTRMGQRRMDLGQDDREILANHTVYLSTTNNWKTETSLSNKPTIKLKNRMSSVVRWLEDIHDPHTPEFLTTTEGLNMERDTGHRNTSLQASDAKGRKAVNGLSGVRHPRQSLRKMVRAKINWLMKEAKGVMRGRSRRRDPSA